MGDVIGLTVWVRLKPPSSTVVYGKVLSLVPNSHLTLRDVLFPGSSSLLESWTIQASAIENLEVVDPSSVPFPPHNTNPQHPPPQSANPVPPNQRPAGPPGLDQRQPQPPQPAFPPARQLPPYVAPATVPPNPTATPQRPSSTFVDPAIVSYGMSPGPSKPGPPATDFETPIKSMLARAAQNLPSPSSPFVGDAGKSNVAQKLVAVKQTPAAANSQSDAGRATAAPSFDGLAQDGAADDAGSKKKTKRGQKAKKMTPSTSQVADPPPVMNVEVSRNGNDMNGTMKRGKGWRSTPLLQPSAQPGAPADKANSKKGRRRRGEEQEFAQGDTTDIQDMGDFDFEGELKKFDKKQVFDEIRQGDTTADEDRLVSHNRAHRPGTYGGKNLHPTEPVLSPKLAPKYNSNELDSSSDADTELNFANGRSSSRHSVSRTVASKSKPSRQNSSQLDPRPHPLAASMTSERGLKTPSVTLVSRGGKALPSLAATSPRPDRAQSPQSAVSSSKGVERSTAASQVLEPHLAIAPLMTPCPTLLPRALESLEDATVLTYGLAHEALAETAARCIAEAALALADDIGGIRRPSRTNTFRGSLTGAPQAAASEMPTVVVLAGNHAVGARALAAARHLAGRGVRIIAAEGLSEAAELLDPQAKAQTAILRRMTRSGASIKRGLWQKALGYIKALTRPPVVIIDALLAGATYESLRAGSATPAFAAAAQQEAREIIDWANRSRAPVLSVACPSGVSGVDGLATTVDGEPLAIRPDKILALAAPMQGLLKAMEHGEKWDIGLADIGVNIALKSDEAVAFGGAWVVDLKYVDDSNASGDGQ